MKKWIVLTLIALFAVSAWAQEKKPKAKDWELSFPETKARFVKVNMVWAKKDLYWEPTVAELEAKFDQLDKDADGKLTQEEYDARLK